MNRLSKFFLEACLTTFVVGLYISFTRAHIPLFLTVALPVSAILYGLFLITFVFQREFGLSDWQERKGPQSLGPHESAPSKRGSEDHAAIPPHRPAYG